MVINNKFNIGDMVYIRVYDNCFAKGKIEAITIEEDGIWYRIVHLYESTDVKQKVDRPECYIYKDTQEIRKFLIEEIEEKIKELESTKIE